MSINYDPDAAEGDKRSGQKYVTKKDILWAALALVVLGAALAPTYFNMKADGEKTMCSQNLQAISKAVQSYAALNDDRMPPIYEEGEGGNPNLIDGVPVNWMTVVESYIGPRTRTVCPSADHKEHSMYYSAKAKGPRPLSYGMFFPVAALPLYQISRPETFPFLTETATGGEMNTYNPVPFVYSNGRVLHDDGFIVGFDNKPDGNFDPAKGVKAVTRLAFYDTKDGKFSDNPKARARHKTGSFIMYSNGAGSAIQPEDAKVKMLGEDVTGLWRTK